MRSKLVSVLVLSLAAFAGAAQAAQAVSTDCRSAGPRGGVAADVAAAIGKFHLNQRTFAVCFRRCFQKSDIVFLDRVVNFSA